MMTKYLPYFLVIIAANAFAQAPPVINDVQPLTGGPAQKLVITGNGFSPTSSQLAVWFDHVPGTITASTNFSIEVQVPPQARFSNLEVINTANFLSGKSKLKFLPSYGGQQLDATKLTSVYNSTETNNELYDVASADLDMNGKPDLVTTKGGPLTLSAITDIYVYQNTSTGIGNINFTRTSVTIGAPTANLTCGDLNGDGKPEIIATRGGSKRNEVLILKNNNSVAGTLAFVSSTSLVLPAPDPSNPNKNVPFAFRVVARDLNGDGKPEIIVNNSQDDNDPTTDNRIYVYQNTSLGGALSFNPIPLQLSVIGAGSTYGLDVQDIDGDSRPEIIVNEFLAPNVFIFRNTSTGNLSFIQEPNVTATAGLNNIISSDLNNDGKLDLVVTATGDSKMLVLINSSSPGSISFDLTQTVTATTTAGPWGVDVSDIDGDGDADILVSNKDGNALNIFRQDSPLGFTKIDYATPNYTSRNLRVGDYDGDAKPDIAYTGIPTSGLIYSFNVIRNANCWNPKITGPSNKICLGQTIPLQTLTALGVNYSWQLNAGGTISTTNSYNATAGGTYTVNLKGTYDATCDNTSVGYVLTADNTSAFPTDPVISNNIPCLGSALNLSTGAVATATYKWAGPASFSSTSQNPTISPVATKNAGTYTLQVTLGNGCQSNIVSKELDVASVPVLPVTASPSATACSGSTLVLNLPSGTSGYSFVWKKGGIAMSPSHTSDTLKLISLTTAKEGDYSVVVTNTSTTCSQETGVTTVKVLTAPIVNFTMSTPHCKGQAIQFTDGSTIDNRATPVYAWNFGDGGTSSSQSPNYSYLTIPSSNPSLTISYSGVTACSGNASQALVVNNPVIPSITVTPNVTSICKGDQTTLSISGSGTFNSIVWTGGTLIGNTPDVIIADSAKYIVNTLDGNGCSGKASVHITLKPTLSLKISTYKNKTSVAPGDTLKLSATAGADSYSWTPAATLSNPAISNPIATPQGSTRYVVVATKAGLCNAKDSIDVRVGVGEAIINPPVLFSPNGDSKNDCWNLCSLPCGISCSDQTKYQDWTMTIYDGQGSMVYQQKGFIEWDGGSAPDGVYYYVFSNSQGKPATGSVLLVRQKQ